MGITELIIAFVVGVVLATIILAVVVLGVIAVLRRGPGSPPGPPAGDEAVAIVRRRYASGEITREQYEQLCQDLANAPGQGA